MSINLSPVPARVPLEAQNILSKRRFDAVMVEGARITDYKPEASSVTKPTELLRATLQSIRRSRATKSRIAA